MSAQWQVNYINNPKSELQIIQEWDSIAEARLNQIDSGLDSSFSKVLAPAILNRLNQKELRVLDIGCGTGTLSQKISNTVREVVALDPSCNSIRLARERHSAGNLHYIHSDAQQYLSNNDNAKGYFNSIVLNMVLMDVIDISSVLNPAYELCGHRGSIYATITHPCFWPKYWLYESSDWFDYSKEIQIEAPFRINSDQLSNITTHIHRPLENYLQAVYEAGFVNVRIEELRENVRHRERVASNKLNYPKFLMIVASKG